jgi:putative ABC transport system substrate-binding protein
VRGAKTNELPVQNPTKYELLINLKTAKALGLTVSLPLMQAATISPSWCRRWRSYMAP